MTGMAGKLDNDKPLMDKDSLDQLSLSAIPLTSSTLKAAKLVKNSRMETAVELYNDPISGSLQIMPEDIADQLATSEKDQEIIRQLASLDSYDVFSLRSSLGKIGVELTDTSLLELSDGMKERLAVYASTFTKPLVAKIFGGSAGEVDTKGGLQKLLRDPDINRVRENLKMITERTGIPMEEIPAFLKDYSDTFMSVAYYKHSLDSVRPDIDRFLKWMAETRSFREVTSSPQTATSCKKVEDSVRFISVSAIERLRMFLSAFEHFWNDINKDSFSQLRRQIEESHTSMGSVLCGLVVKMQVWAKEFPDNDVGGPTKRAKFVMTELEPGIDRLRLKEVEARARLGMK